MSLTVARPGTRCVATTFQMLLAEVKKGEGKALEGKKQTAEQAKKLHLVSWLYCLIKQTSKGNWESASNPQNLKGTAAAIIAAA